MNERTHFFIKIDLSDFILERVDVSSVWEVSWRRGQTARYWPKVPLTIAALFSHSGWAAQPWVIEGRKPSVCKLILTLASCPSCRPLASWGRTHLHLIQPRPQVKVIFRYLRPDSPVSQFFCLFTQVHLLIDSSVEGQCYNGFLT